MFNCMYASNDMYNSGGGSTPVPIGNDIIIETIAGIYDASNDLGFSGSTDSEGEWVAGAFKATFSKTFDLVGTLVGALPDPTAKIKYSLHNFAGIKLAETNFFSPPQLGTISAFLNSSVSLVKGATYYWCIFGNKNLIIKYKNGLQGIGALKYGIRSNGIVNDIPNDISTGSISPIFPYGVLF